VTPRLPHALSRALLLAAALLLHPACDRLLRFLPGSVADASGDGVAVSERGRGERGASDLREDGPRTEAGRPPRCGGTSLLTDDFADGVRAPEWGRGWTNPGMTAVETAGQLVFTLDPAGGTYAGYESQLTYDLTGDRVFVEVPTLPSGEGSEATLALEQEVGASMEALTVLYLAGESELRLSHQRDKVEQFGQSVPAGAGTRWWQIREAGGTIHWETSADGKSWSTRASLAAPFSPRAVRVVLMVGTWKSVASPGTTAFARFNGGGAPSGQHCPASSLTDDFGDGVRGPEWANSWSDSECTIGEKSGELVGTPPAGVESYCAHETSSAYRLTGSSITVEVKQMVSGEAIAALNAQTMSSARLSLRVAEGQLRFRSQVNGTVTDVGPAISWDPVACRWWRLREAGGACFWETAPDGKSWTTRASAACPIDTSRVAIGLWAGAEAPETAPGEVHFDKLNLP